MFNQDILEVVAVLFVIGLLLVFAFLGVLEERKRQREYDRFREELLDNLGSIANSLNSFNINYYKKHELDIVLHDCFCNIDTDKTRKESK